MSHLPFTLLAYFLNSIAVLIDKFQLERNVLNPLIYVFYMSIFSLIALFLLPLTKIPSLEAITFASSSTILWTIGLYLMFKALQKGNVSRVIPVIGTLIPLFLLIHAVINHSINLNEIWAVIFLILGLVFLTMKDFVGNFNYEEIIYEVGSAIFFTISYIILKEAYLRADFLSVFVYSRFVLIPIGIVIVLVPKLRKIVLGNSHSTHPGFNPLNFFKSWGGVLFFIGQAAGGISELLLTFSISLATPALVNSLQGTQYAFLFIFSLALSKKYPQVYKENLSPKIVVGKILGIILIGVGLYILAFAQPMNKKLDLAVTFSPRYASELMSTQDTPANPMAVYKNMLADLPIKQVRLPVYWDEVETAPNRFNFSEVDPYIEEAAKKNVGVVLVLGYKQPRWPECYAPSWLEGFVRGRPLAEAEEIRDQRILNLVREEVNHFKKFDNITAWQVENEPFLSFGKCPQVTDKTFQRVKQELEIVKSLDQRPTLITDSGELTSWRKSLGVKSDWFGFTLYRTVWSPWFGTVGYPLPPIFYNLKSVLAQTFTNHHPQKILIAELQAEPWVTTGQHIVNTPLEELIILLPPEKLTENINFAKQTHFSPVFLWGVEWWYYMQDRGYPQYLDTIKSLFN